MIVCSAEKNDKSEQGSDIQRMINTQNEYLEYIKKKLNNGTCGITK